MAWKNVKKKYMMCQIQIKILKQNAIPNSSLPPNLKIYSLKDAEKLFKYDQRTVTRQFQNLEFSAKDITSGYVILL